MFFYLELKIHGLLISHIYYWFEINKLNPFVRFHVGSGWDFACKRIYNNKCKRKWVGKKS